MKISFILIYCSSIYSNSDFVSKQALKSALFYARGIYKDHSKSNMYNNTVFVTSGNFGYVNHFHNSKCFLDRWGIKILFIAMDERTHAYMAKIPDTYSALYKSNNYSIQEQSHRFRSKNFNYLSRSTIEAVYEILTHNYSVMFVESDVVLINDPVKFFIWNNVDYVHAVNMACSSAKWDFYKSNEEGNTGFYFIRSNVQILSFMKYYFVTAAKDVNYELDNQSLFWSAMRSCKDPLITPLDICAHQPARFQQQQQNEKENSKTFLVTCHPDTCLTGTGAIASPSRYHGLKEMLKLKMLDMLAVHANNLVGNEMKMKKLMHHDLWLAIPGPNGTWTGKCSTFKRPYSMINPS